MRFILDEFYFCICDAGLWAIYGTPTNSLIVMKVEPELMRPQYAWEININHHKYGEMFIARGVLYAVNSVTATDMTIK